MSTSSSNTIKKNCGHGLLQLGHRNLVSDNWPQFTSVESRDFVKYDEIKHTPVAPYHLQSNGLAERGCQFSRKCLEGSILMGANGPQQRLANFLLRYRVTPHCITGTTPANMFFKRQLRTRLSCINLIYERMIMENNRRWRNSMMGETPSCENFRRKSRLKWRRLFQDKNENRYLG